MRREAEVVAMLNRVRAMEPPYRCHVVIDAAGAARLYAGAQALASQRAATAAWAASRAMRHRDFRTPAERSMDDLNRRRRELLARHRTEALSVAERGELARVNRQLDAARRNVRQMREGLR